MTDQKTTLKPYIEQQLQTGMAPDEIRRILVDHGWEEAVVNEVLGEMTVEQPAPSVSAEITAELEAIRQETLPERYGIRTAVKEAASALSYNLRTTLIVVAIGIGASALTTFVAAATLTPLVPMGPRYLGTIEPLSGASTPLALIIAASIGIVIAQLLLNAYMQSVILLSINAGADKKKTPVKTVLALGLGRFIRFAVANLLFSLTIATPMIVAGTAGIALSFISSGYFWAITVLVVIGAVAAIPLLVRFIIMPYVALFEPETPLRAVFRRSKFLMGGAFGFIAKVLFILIITYVIVTIAMQNIDQIGESALILISLPSVIIWGILGLLMNAVLVVFYRNRKVVKDKPLLKTT